jgi:hypothetical protein
VTGQASELLGEAGILADLSHKLNPAFAPDRKRYGGQAAFAPDRKRYGGQAAFAHDRKRDGAPKPAIQRTMSTLFNNDVRASVTARVRRLRPDSARQWGRMTPHQMLCHSSDAFKMALRDREVAPVPMTFKPLLKFVALTLPMQWPRARIKTVPEAEQGVGGTPPTEFEGDRAELLALIERFGSARAEQLCPVHPVFGSMTAELWGRWAYRHMDHHLRQFGV